MGGRGGWSATDVSLSPASASGMPPARAGSTSSTSLAALKARLASPCHSLSLLSPRACPDWRLSPSAGYLPYIGMVTIIMNDYPLVKCAPPAPSNSGGLAGRGGGGRA